MERKLATCIISLLLLLYGSWVYAQYTSTTQGGAWSNKKTWIGEQVPPPGVSVVIQGPVYVDVGNVVVSSLTVTSTGRIGGITVTGNATNYGTIAGGLTVQGNGYNYGMWDGGSIRGNFYNYATGRMGTSSFTIDGQFWNEGTVEVNTLTLGQGLDTKTPVKATRITVSQDQIWRTKNDSLPPGQQIQRITVGWLDGAGRITLASPIQLDGGILNVSMDVQAYPLYLDGEVRLAELEHVRTIYQLGANPPVFNRVVVRGDTITLAGDFSMRGTLNNEGLTVVANALRNTGTITGGRLALASGVLINESGGDIRPLVLELAGNLRNQGRFYPDILYIKDGMKQSWSSTQDIFCRRLSLLATSTLETTVYLERDLRILVREYASLPKVHFNGRGRYGLEVAGTWGSVTFDSLAFFKTAFGYPTALGNGVTFAQGDSIVFSSYVDVEGEVTVKPALVVRDTLELSRSGALIVENALRNYGAIRGGKNTLRLKGRHFENWGDFYVGTLNVEKGTHQTWHTARPIRVHQVLVSGALSDTAQVDLLDTLRVHFNATAGGNKVDGSNFLRINGRGQHGISQREAGVWRNLRLDSLRFFISDSAGVTLHNVHLGPSDSLRIEGNFGASFLTVDSPVEFRGIFWHAAHANSVFKKPVINRGVFKNYGRVRFEEGGRNKGQFIAEDASIELADTLWNTDLMQLRKVGILRISGLPLGSLVNQKDLTLDGGVTITGRLINRGKVQLQGGLSLFGPFVQAPQGRMDVQGEFSVGDTRDLTFTGTVAIAPGKQFKVRARTLSLTPGTRIEITFESPATRKTDPYSQLVVRGRLRLGGATLVLKGSDPYNAAPGDTLYAMLATSVQDSLGSIRSLHPFFSFEPIYTGTQVWLRAKKRQGGTVTVLPDSLLNGGFRWVNVFADSMPQQTTVWLKCVSACEPVGTQIAGKITQQGTQKLVVAFSLPDTVFGRWHLIVQRPGIGVDSVQVPIHARVGFPVIYNVSPWDATRILVRPERNIVNTWRIADLSVSEPTDTLFYLVFVEVPEHPAVRAVVRNQQGDTLWVRKGTVSRIPVVASLSSGGYTDLHIDLGVHPNDVLWRVPSASTRKRLSLQGGWFKRILFGSRHKVSVKGMIEASKEQLSGALMDALYTTGHQAMADFLFGLDPNIVQGLIDNLIAQFPTNLSQTPRWWLEQIVTHLAGTYVPGYNVYQALQLVADVAESFRQSFEKAIINRHAKAEVDAYRRARGDEGLFIEYGLRARGGFFGHGLGAMKATDIIYKCPSIIAKQKPCSPITCNAAGDETEAIVAAAFDPNDKLTESTYSCEVGTVLVDGKPVTRCVRYFVPQSRANEPLTYTIKFENRPQATLSAERVVIVDTLDSALDPATLSIIGVSHPDVFSYKVQGQIVTFTFEGIYLPPNHNPPEGEGSVRFSVRPRSGLPPRTVIPNRAAIQFDYNPYIYTPYVTHVITPSSDLVLHAPLVKDGVVTRVSGAFPLVVINRGPDPADSVLVLFSVSDSLQIDSVQVPIGSVCEKENFSLSCLISQLNVQDSVTFNLTIRPKTLDTLWVMGLVQSLVAADEDIQNNEITAMYRRLMGDVDGNWEVTVTDAVWVLRHIVGLTQLKGDQLQVADFNKDGTVSITDVVLILRAIVYPKMDVDLDLAGVRGHARWGDMTHETEGVRLPLVLENADHVYGLELEVTLPENSRVANVEVPDGWIEAHRTENGTFRLAMAGLYPASGEVVVLHLRGVKEVLQSELSGKVVLNGLLQQTIGEEVPASYALLPGYPNPFNDQVTIRFALPKPDVVTLEVFDLLGRRVTYLLKEEELPAGWHIVRWRPACLASGTYIYRIRTKKGNFHAERKVVQIK